MAVPCMKEEVLLCSWQALALQDRSSLVLINRTVSHNLQDMAGLAHDVSTCPRSLWRFPVGMASNWVLADRRRNRPQRCKNRPQRCGRELVPPSASLPALLFSRGRVRFGKW